jgi:hypothetical protein
MSVRDLAGRCHATSRPETADRGGFISMPDAHFRVITA